MHRERQGSSKRYCELQSRVSTSAATDCIKDALTIQLKFNAAYSKLSLNLEILPGETRVGRKSLSLCRREGITRRGGLEKE
jgi:hypothetical protein